jgi:hypothetical protein
MSRIIKIKDAKTVEERLTDISKRLAQNQNNPVILALRKLFRQNTNLSRASISEMSDFSDDEVFTMLS